MKYLAVLLLFILILPVAQLEAQGVELSYYQLTLLMKGAEGSADFTNLIARAKLLGFKEVRYLGFKIEKDLILGVLLDRGKDRALLMFRVFEDGYSEAYLYFEEDRVLLDSMSRSGVMTTFENGVCRTCRLRVEPLEAGCEDCYSSGCRPCCGKQISCPIGRYADCKYICRSWDHECLILCGLSIPTCGSCGTCFFTGNPAACYSCVLCAIASLACRHCCSSSYCACRCIKYH